MTSIKQYAVEYAERRAEGATRVNPATALILQAMNNKLWGTKPGDLDRMFQDMNNNLWDNNPGELDRWADDGGPVP